MSADKYALYIDAHCHTDNAEEDKAHAIVAIIKYLSATGCDELVEAWGKVLHREQSQGGKT